MPRFSALDIPYSIRSPGADGAIALSIPDAPNLNPLAGIGFSIFLYPTGIPKTFIVFDKTQSGATNSYFVSVSADGSPNWFSFINGIGRNLSASGKSVRIRWNQPNLLEGGYSNGIVSLLVNGQKLTEEITGLSGNLGVTSQALRILSYFTGATGLNFQGYAYRPRLYTRTPSLDEHRELWFNRQRNGDLEQNNLLLDLAMTEGSGGTVADISQYGTDATIGGLSSWSTFSPAKLRAAASTPHSDIAYRRTDGQNIPFKNQFFEYIPSFTALQTATGWIDGTATGSATDNRSGVALSGKDGSVEAGFDTVETYNDGPTLYMATTAPNSRVTLQSALTTSGAGREQLIPIKPNTAYVCKFAMKTNHISGDSDSGAFGAFVERTSAGSQAVVNASAIIKTDTDWTEYTVSFTSGATSAFLSFRPSVTGNTGAADLIMQAWLSPWTVSSPTLVRTILT